MLGKGRRSMENRLRLRNMPLQERRCAPTIGHRWLSFRRRRPYAVRFEHSREPLQVRAADLRELRAYLRANHPGRPIVSIRDWQGNLAGAPPVAAAASAGRWQAVVTVAVGLGAFCYGLTWLLP